MLFSLYVLRFPTVDFSKFERRCGVSFQNKNLLKQAFTHRSYLNENRRAGLLHNERLEFLGDAVLELIVTEELFRRYPERNEGEMTSYRSALVNTNTLSEVAGKLGMNDHLLLSRGEARDSGRARQVILANTFEAVVGAIFLDQGYAAAVDFIKGHLFPLLPKIVETGKWADAKSLFQEKAQDLVGVTPSYRTLKEEGPDHDKQFTVGVYLGYEKVADGVGKSKQEAEQEAAKLALEARGWS